MVLGRMPVVHTGKRLRSLPPVLFAVAVTAKQGADILLEPHQPFLVAGGVYQLMEEGSMIFLRTLEL